MNVTDIPILSILIFLPLLGAIVLAILPAHDDAARSRSAPRC